MNNFYELGMKNLYDSVNAIKIGKTILSHTSCIMEIVQCTTGFRKRCSKTAVNLQENTHAEVRFQLSCKATLLKSHLGIGALL